MSRWAPPSVTKQQLLQALNEHKSVLIAADHLGIVHQIVYRLIKKYHVRKVVSWK